VDEKGSQYNAGLEREAEILLDLLRYNAKLLAQVLNVKPAEEAGSCALNYSRSPYKS
jgi:hypothetical protein